MNVCSLSGRLVWRTELRYQLSGKPELSLRLSVPNGERDGKRFFLPFDVTVFGKDCEILAESLERDDLVELTGQNTWPKPSRKPGGTAIPAVICFSVTKLSGSVLSEHEPSPEYGQNGDEVSVSSDASKVVAESKPRRPHYPKVTREPWQPEHAN